MEETAQCFKEKHICSLFGVARSESLSVREDSNWHSGGLCLKPNRLDSGFRSGYWIPGRSAHSAPGYLARPSTGPKGCLGRMPKLSCRTRVRTTTESPCRYRDRDNLAVGNSRNRAVDRNLASWISETIIDLSKSKNDMTIACSRTKLPRCACSLAADAGRYAYEQSGKNVSVKDLVSYARIEVR